MMFPDLTVRTRYGACDLAPFLRRDAGENAPVCDWEKPAAALALRGRGWTIHRVARAVGLSHEVVQEILDGRWRPARPSTEASLAERSRRERRRAERVMVDGRLVHPGAPHGEPRSQKNWGCQCVPCSEANVVLVREQRERARARRSAA